MKRPNKFDRALVHAFVVHPRMVLCALVMMMVLAFVAGLLVDVVVEPCLPQDLYNHERPACSGERKP